MKMEAFPVIDMIATGKNITRLRLQRGISVRDMQDYFGFEAPQAIYKWQKGLTLPSVDNLYALSAFLDVPMDCILVSKDGFHSERRVEDGRSQHIQDSCFDPDIIYVAYGNYRHTECQRESDFERPALYVGGIAA